MAQRRIETTRGLYGLSAFVLGAFGVLMVVAPAQINDLLAGPALSRWLGLVGVVGAGACAILARRVGREPLPTDWAEQKAAAREDGDWKTLYEMWVREADRCQRDGRVQEERRARETLVKLAVERLDHGEFQALAHLERIEALVGGQDEIDALERQFALHGDVGSQQRRVEVLERVLALEPDDATLADIEEALGEDGKEGESEAAEQMREMIDRYRQRKPSDRDN